jgi:choline dehydrogenase-like flavoprotein
VIVDSFERLSEPARKPEVAIVGAGAVGIALAVQLARAGLQVTVIEGGPASPPVDYRKANAAGSTGRAHLGLLDGRMKALGGTTRLWGGQLMAFGENDLAAGTYAAKPGWPITPEELASATAKALELLGIPPDLRDGAAVHRAASGVDPALDPRLELAIATWLPQPDFARLFARELRDLPGLVVLTGHRVTGLETPQDGQFPAALLSGADGSTSRLEPRRIVLANGTFELTAMLLRLAARSESRIAGKAHLGRWFIDHLHAIGGTIRGIDRLRLGNLSDAVFHKGHKFTVKLRLSSQLQREAGVPNVAAMILPPLGPRELLRELFGLARRSTQGADSPGLVRTLAMLGPLAWRYLVKRRGPNLLGNSAFLGIEVEQVVCPESRISLDPDDPEWLVLNWVLDGAAEMRGVRLFCEAVRDYLVREGLGELEIDPRILAEDPNFLDDAHDAYHQMGGARMAESAEHGVVDADLKVFGTENLYVLGAATFPSGSFANPTLTALALSVRLAEHLQGLQRS